MFSFTNDVSRVNPTLKRGVNTVRFHKLKIFEKILILKKRANKNNYLRI
jgi:hypothetical protein